MNPPNPTSTPPTKADAEFEVENRRLLAENMAIRAAYDQRTVERDRAQELLHRFNAEVKSDKAVVDWIEAHANTFPSRIIPGGWYFSHYPPFFTSFREAMAWAIAAERKAQP